MKSSSCKILNGLVFFIAVLFASATLAQDTVLSAANRLLENNGPTCDVPRETLELKRGTLIYNICKNSCFGELVYAELNNLDLNSIKIFALPHSPKLAVVIIPCKTGNDCVISWPGDSVML